MLLAAGKQEAEGLQRNVQLAILDIWKVGIYNLTYIFMFKTILEDDR